MNKPSKFALALAFAAVTASGVASAQTVDNWRNPFGNVLEERHERTVLARCLLDPGHRYPRLRRRPGCSTEGEAGPDGGKGRVQC